MKKGEGLAQDWNKEDSHKKRKQYAENYTNELTGMAREIIHADCGRTGPSKDRKRYVTATPSPVQARHPARGLEQKESKKWEVSGRFWGKFITHNNREK